MQSRLEVWGSKGTLEVDLLRDTGMRRTAGEGAQAWRAESADWLWENGYPQELEHFLTCFREGRTPEESGEDGVRVLEILEAAYRSAREGRTVALDEALPPVERAVDHWLGRPAQRRSP
jgi:predicted dehydrogenase